MAVHSDLILSRITLTDTQGRYVAAQTGSLVTVYKTKRFTFTGTVGDKTVYINNAVAGKYHEAGLQYSYGLRYDMSNKVHLAITTGQDLGITQFHEGPDYLNYLRFDADFSLF